MHARIYTIALHISCLLFFFLKSVAANCQTVCTFSIDPQLSSEINSQITQQIQQTIASTGFNAHKMLHVLNKDFPFISRVVIARNQKPHVFVTAYVPIAQINDNQVILENDAQTGAENFSPSAYANCIHIKYDGTGTFLLHECAQFLHNMPLAMRTHYNCMWHDKTKILLSHKNSPHIAIITTYDKKCDDMLVNALEGLINTLHAQTKEKKMPGLLPRWLIDARCKKQLIIARDKKGGL